MEKENLPAPLQNQEEWQTDTFRASMILKLDTAIKESRCPITMTAHELEMQLFAKSNSQTEYLTFIGRLLMHIHKLAEEEVKRQQHQQQQQPQVVNDGDTMGGGIRTSSNVIIQEGGNPNVAVVNQIQNNNKSNQQQQG